MKRLMLVLVFGHSFLVAAGIGMTGRQWFMPLSRTTDSSEQAEPSALVMPLPATINPPQVVIDHTRLDIGDIPRGKSARFAFFLYNKGSGPLQIAAKAGCGCTVVRHDTEIPAGGQSKLEAELRTHNMQGVVTKSIDVHTNDPKQPKLHLELSANIKSAVDILPSDRPVFSLNMTGPTLHELQLRTSAAEQVELIGVQCSEPYVAAVLEPFEEEASHRSYRLKLVFEPQMSVGRSNVHLTLKTTAKHESQVPVTVRCEKGIIVSPASVQLRPAADDADQFQPIHLLISKHDGNLQITSVECNDPRVELQSQALKAGSTYRLSVTGENRESASAAMASITIRTNDADQPQLEIPVQFPGKRRQTTATDGRLAPHP